MILKVMTEDGYSIYPGIRRVDFYSGAKTAARVWALARPEDDPFGDFIFTRKGDTDELIPSQPNYCHIRPPFEGRQSVCLLSGDMEVEGGTHFTYSWAFHEAYLMDDAGRTIEHLF